MAQIKCVFLLAWLSCSFALKLNVSPGSLKTVTLPVPVVASRSCLSLSIEGGDGQLQVSSSFQGSLSAWSVRLAPGSRHSRPLCSAPGIAAQNLFLTLLSTANKTIDVSISIEEQQNYLIKAGTEVEFASNQHSAFRFDLSVDAIWNLDQFMLSIKNPGGQCLEVAISDPSCPWRDDLATITTNKMWARVLKQALFPVNAKNFNLSKSFVIFVLPAKNQHDCFNDYDPFRTAEQKPVTLVVTKISSDYATPISYLVGALLIVSIPTVSSLILFWFRKRQKEGEVEPDDGTCKSAAHNLDNVCERPIHDLDQVDAVVDGDGHNSLKRRGTQLLPELVTRVLTDNLHRYLRSDAYFHVVPLLVVFYAIPSWQLAFLTVDDKSETCSFNYGCARPLLKFKAFNHIFSNLGYIWFGLCFMLLVWVKSTYFKEDYGENRLKKRRGLPQQSGLYYAMGLASVAQGLLSAIFHICPSNLSLQFDTTMMYLIMTLVMVKVYQFRHPDTTIRFYYCLYALALALVFEAISVHLIEFSTTTVAIFTALFCIFYALFVVWIGHAFYLNRQSRRIKSQSAIDCCSCIVLSWLHIFITFWFVIINLCVMVYIIYSVWAKEKSLSTPLLIVIGCNMFLYLGYYMLRKFNEIIFRLLEKEHRTILLEKNQEAGAPEEDMAEQGWLHWLARILHLKCDKKCDEKDVETLEFEEEAKEEADNEGQCSVNMVRWLSYILFFIALAFAMIAAFFYANKHQSRNLSPAESRQKNEECVFLEFYDNHDLWHFFSSLALFLAFLGLLTIDDDLLYVSMDRIKVF